MGRESQLARVEQKMGAHTTQEQRVEIKILAARGLTQEKISQITGRPQPTVNRVIKAPLKPKKVCLSFLLL